MSRTTIAAKRRNAWILTSVVAATTLVYINAFRNGFIDFDDPENVESNYSIRALDLTNLKHFFTTPLQFMYTPLVSISYAIDYHFGKAAPWIYHTTNLALHLINIVLVYHLCRALTKKVFVAHFAAVAFAIHPSNVDTVSWVSTRSTLLATMFSLATLIAYLRYRKTDKAWQFLISVFFFVLAVLCKSTAVALPFSLVLIDFCRARKLDWWMALEKVPFFGVAAGAGILGLHFRADQSSLYRYTIVDRVFVVCSALVAYLVRLVVPYPISFAYAYPPKHGGWLPWYVYLAPVVLAAVVVVLYRTPVPKKLLLFGLGFFVLNIVLTQAVLLVDNYKANRYAYLPYVGLLLIAGYLVNALVEAVRARRPELDGVMAGALAILALSFGVLTFQRSTLWVEPVSVLDNAIAHEPGVPFLYNSRGTSHYNKGEYTAALADFNKAVSLDPKFTLGYYYIGVIKSTSGDFKGAIVEFDKAISLSSRFSYAYNERGKAKIGLKDYDGAVSDLSQAIHWDSYFADAYLQRGEAYTYLNKFPEAIDDFNRVIALDPGRAQAYSFRGSAYLESGNADAAMADLNRAIDLDPGYGEAYYNRGVIKFRSNNTSGACADWQIAVGKGSQEASNALGEASCPSASPPG